ncbi:hypothetical protein [Paenibacillus donghaensis]|nr:hypothetical protein [Paenibacillus donghaensis]
MMNVKINGTDKTATLSMFNDNTGVDSVVDFVGNYDALADGKFVYDDETGTYSTDQDTFDWWDKVITDNKLLEERIADLKVKHDPEAVDEVVHASADVDLEDMAAAVNKALDEGFEGSEGK